MIQKTGEAQPFFEERRRSCAVALRAIKKTVGESEFQKLLKEISISEEVNRNVEKPERRA